MKRIIYYILLITFSATIVSCEDFLREESEYQFTTNSLFETPEGLEKMVIALYPYERSISRAGNSNGFLGSFLWGERTTDLVVFTTGDDANLSRYTSPGPSSNIGDLIYNPFWTRRYYLIGRANEIIYYGKEFGDETIETVAEASFWRAYCYYGLWSRFSRLFLTTEPITRDNMEDLVYTPADSADVFKLMYEDLTRAVEGLPASRKNTDQSGRVDRAAARHLKALVAAWAKDWQTVADEVEAIEAEGAYTLATDVTNIFNRQDLHNVSEALFTLIFSNERGGGDGHRLGTQYINTIAEQSYTTKLVNGQQVKYHEDNLGKSWGLVFPNSYLMSLYNPDDQRLKGYYKKDYTYQNPEAIVTVPPSDLLIDENTGRPYRTTFNMSGQDVTTSIGDIIYGRDLVAGGKNKLDRRAILPSSLKMCDLYTKSLDTDGPISYKDQIIYRLSESFLLAAEAHDHLGNQERARYYYNQIWTRAGNEPVTGEITFDMIRDENARELAFEGRRWDFLKRNGIWYSQMAKYAGDFTQYPGAGTLYDRTTYTENNGRDPEFGPNPDYYADFTGSDNDVLVRFNVRPFHVNWPIPQAQIDAMGEENFPQTEGYR
ncbi:MAG: RagB/SusD family nutrient uptake outer membrane protein [Tannerellaceae bacterium]|nr:RagB/SusD family nutrient uptake outer membrane protein [Tannerellaceae bacterium]